MPPDAAGAIESLLPSCIERVERVRRLDPHAFDAELHAQVVRNMSRSLDLLRELHALATADPWVRRPSLPVRPQPAPEPAPAVVAWCREFARQYADAARTGLHEAKRVAGEVYEHLHLLAPRDAAAHMSADPLLARMVAADPGVDRRGWPLQTSFFRSTG